MSGGYRPGSPPTELAPIFEELDTIARRLDTLERPTAEATYQTVAKLRALVEDIQEQLDQYNAGRYTNAQINSLVSNAVAFPGNVQSSGQIAAPTLIGGNVFAQSLATNITATRVSLWGRTADGFIGTASSSEKFKANIRPVDRDPRTLMDITVSYWEYIDEVKKRDDPTFEGYVGPDYHVSTNVGVIAERLHELGYWEYVVYERNDDGSAKLTDEGEPIPYAVHDILLAYAIIPFVQEESRRLDALADRVANLESAKG